MFFVPPCSSPRVYLSSYLIALVILCWKANLPLSNLLPLFYCCFCTGRTNKHRPNIWCLSGTLYSWPEWACGRTDRTAVQLDCKSRHGPKDTDLYRVTKNKICTFLLISHALKPWSEQCSVLPAMSAGVTHFAVWAQGLPCASIYPKRGRMQRPVCIRSHWTEGLEPELWLEGLFLSDF